MGIKEIADPMKTILIVEIIGVTLFFEKEEKNKVMEANTHHELEMIKQQRDAEARLFKDIDPRSGLAGESDADEKRMDIIGQNGNTGEHYEELNRGNWWGLADDWDTEDEWETPKLDTYKGANYTGRNREPDATGMEEDLPSAAEDSAKVRGNYEI